MAATVIYGLTESATITILFENRKSISQAKTAEQLVSVELCVLCVKIPLRSLREIKKYTRTTAPQHKEPQHQELKPLQFRQLLINTIKRHQFRMRPFLQNFPRFHHPNNIRMLYRR